MDGLLFERGRVWCVLVKRWRFSCFILSIVLSECEQCKAMECDMKKEVSVKLYGVLSSFGEDGLVTLAVGEDATVSDLKSQLREHIQEIDPGFDLSVLDSSAVGSDEAILTNSDCLKSVDSLAVLPPVCGG
jgi:molybdopterin converting factor small subunit